MRQLNWMLCGIGLGVAFLSGCNKDEGSDDGDGTELSADAYFEENLATLMSSCSGCHTVGLDVEQTQGATPLFDSGNVFNDLSATPEMIRTIHDNEHVTNGVHLTATMITTDEEEADFDEKLSVFAKFFTVDIGTAGSEARAYYEENITPVLALTGDGGAGCAACHGSTPIGTVILAGSPWYTEAAAGRESFTGAIAAYPFSNDTHADLPNFDATSFKASVEEWSDLEDAEIAEEPEIDPEEPNPALPLKAGKISNLVEAEHRLVACAQQLESEFAARELYLIAEAGTGDGPCLGCHQGNVGNFVATDDMYHFFSMMSGRNVNKNGVLVPDDVDGGYNLNVLAPRVLEAGQVDSHPQYDDLVVNGTNYTDEYEEWTLLLKQWFEGGDAGACDAGPVLDMSAGQMNLGLGAVEDPNEPYTIYIDNGYTSAILLTRAWAYEGEYECTVMGDCNNGDPATCIVDMSINGSVVATATAPNAQDYVAPFDSPVTLASDTIIQFELKGAPQDEIRVVTCTPTLDL